MEDIRLKTMPYEYRGRTYTLACNMNVLADVQADFNGDIGAALNRKNGIRATFSFLAAMMNDWADSQGWPERVTAKELGRDLTDFATVGRLGGEIFALVAGAMKPAEETGEETEKNGETTQSPQAE